MNKLQMLVNIDSSSIFPPERHPFVLFPQQVFSKKAPETDNAATSAF